MLSTGISSLQDITAQIKAPRNIALDFETIDKGIDNYHSDIEISVSFALRVKEAIEQNFKRLVGGKALMSGNSETMHEVRDAYTDMMRVTFHRTKTDLTPAQIDLLQFGVVKFIIDEVRDIIEKYGQQLEETVGQQQYSGSRSLMATQEKVSWFRKHSHEFYYRLMKLFLKQLQREENNHLKGLRAQILPQFPEAPLVLFNPMLYSPGPRDPLLLLDYYAVWPGMGAEFVELNEKVEQGIAKHFPREPFMKLKEHDKLEASQAEVYDEFGGLFAAQLMLGPAEDQKDKLSESFSWMEHPGNVRLLFDEKVHQKHLENGGGGFFSSSALKGDLKKLQKACQELKKSLGDRKSLRKALVSYALREKLGQQELDLIDVEDVLELVSGNDSRKVHDAIDLAHEGAAALATKLEACRNEFDQQFRESEDELFLRFLTDFCRYRMHLKYYRLAHRVFNRITVITEPEKIQLAKAGGHLYQLLSSDEVKDIGVDETPEVVHHAILKADVRGSTTVTSELTKQGLNPASYFSLRFFNPITERLKTYGAVKVFIEGDAVILGVYEYQNAPDQWFSVSRACGIAKEILDIVTSKNAHSKQTGLPLLEIGIGICYRDDKPLFLFDENRPIMISSAIGDADRMSSCSWQLREQYDSGNFNVGVFLLDDGDSQKGEKGQHQVRYNVNGIVIDDAAFKKLQTEVHFRRLKAKSGGDEEVFFVGQYPDVMGKQRDLVVREGQVGSWQAGSAHDSDNNQHYYEVLPNTKFANQIAGLTRKKGA